MTNEVAFNEYVRLQSEILMQLEILKESIEEKLDCTLEWNFVPSYLRLASSSTVLFSASS